MTTATIFEAKTNLSELIKKAEAGEKVVITRGRSKEPAVELTPVTPRQPMRFGFLKHLNLNIPDSFFFDPLPEDEQRLWDGEDE